jgi:hypothetical protein
MQTVEQVLTAATDSVTLINDINTNGANSIFWTLGSNSLAIQMQLQLEKRIFQTILNQE